MTLIKNPSFSNERVVIGSYVVQFNEEGVADFPDQDLIASLLQIPGFSLVEEPPSEPSQNAPADQAGEAAPEGGRRHRRKPAEDEE